MTTFRPLASKPHPIEQIVLLPSSGGRFEVMLDGALIYSKAATGRHPDNEAIVTQVRARLRR